MRLQNDLTRKNYVFKKEAMTAVAELLEVVGEHFLHLKKKILIESITT